jgi:hypothetical protein
VPLVPTVVTTPTGSRPSALIPPFNYAEHNSLNSFEAAVRHRRDIISNTSAQDPYDIRIDNMLGYSFMEIVIPNRGLSDRLKLVFNFNKSSNLESIFVKYHDLSRRESL